MKRVHLDTDLGSDTDDLCALALLLALPDTQVVGVTTSSDLGGLRVGMVDRALDLAGRRGVPVASGAEGSLAGFQTPVGFPDPPVYWSTPIVPRPTPPGQALDLLAASIASGATVVVIGPYTNLALLEVARPGTLARADLVLMGGYVAPPRPGLPQWGPEMDYNVQQDTAAALLLYQRADPLIVPLGVTLEVALRGRALPRLRAAGPLPALLAHQAELHGRDNTMGDLHRQYPALPDDLLNFQYDALACAAAVGWPGLTVSTLPLLPTMAGGVLSLPTHPTGKPTRVVTAVDGERFAHYWLDAVAPSPIG